MSRSSGPSLRTAALVATAPLWVPLVLLAGLCGLCTDGLLYQLEGLLGRPLAVGRAGRVMLALPSLALFPAVSTVDVALQFVAAAGRWPLHLSLDGVLVGVFGLSCAAVGGWVEMPAPLVGVAAGLLMAAWLTAGNLVRRGAWLHKGVTLVGVVTLAAVTASLHLLLSDPTRPALPLLGAVGAAVIAAAAGALGMLLLRRRLVDLLYAPWEPRGATGAVVATLRGLAAVVTMPLWFVVLAMTWCTERIFGELLLPDLEHRVRSGGLRSAAGRSRFSTFIGLRYMKGKRDQRFVSLITVLSVLAVAMGVWTLTVVLSVMSGFEVDLRDKILGTNSHVVVLNYVGTFPDYREAMETIREVEDVRACTPFIYTELMVKHDDSVTGAIFKGVDPETAGDVTALVESIDRGPRGPIGSLEEKRALLAGIDDPITLPEHRVIPDPDQDLPGLIIGEEMATVLRAAVGDVVLVTSPFGEPGPFGTMVTTMQKFRVKGIFYSGMYEYDAKFIYVSLETAQRFLKFDDEVTGIEVVVDDLYGADAVAAELEQRLGYPFWTRDWMAMNKNLFSALKLEKTVMAIILSFIYVGAALNIIVVLIMVVMEKQKEIAILRAMGTTKDQLMRAFMIEGLIIGFVGTTMGTALGWLSCWALARYRFIPLDTDVYYLDTLPVAMSPWTFVGVAVFAITVCFLATLYPAWYAAELDPVEGLRYE